jgi:hypothetical protein
MRGFGWPAQRPNSASCAQHPGLLGGRGRVHLDTCFLPRLAPLDRHIMTSGCDFAAVLVALADSLNAEETDGPAACDPSVTGTRRAPLTHRSAPSCYLGRTEGAA